MTTHKLFSLPLIAFSSFFLSACSLGNPPQTGNTPQGSTQESSPSASAVNPESAKIKLRDLITQNKTLKCNLKLTTDDVDSTETVYVQNGKSKIVSNVKINNGSSFESNMVVDGTTAYTWQTGSSQGIKVNVQNYANTGNNSQNTDNGRSVDLNGEYDYSCEPWNGQGQDFAPPSAVTFTEIGESLKKMEQGLKNICDSLSGDAKTECLKSMESDGN